MPSKKTNPVTQILPRLQSAVRWFGARLLSVLTPIGRWANRHKVLALILFALIGFFLYRTAVIQMDKRKFHKAEVALEKVIKNLEQSSVVPEVRKECASPEAKFGKAALQCGMSLEYDISDLSVEAETRLVQNFENAIKGTGLVAPNPLQYPLINLDMGSGTTYELPNNKAECGILYETIRSTSRFKVSLTCIIRPKFPIY